MSLKRDQIEAFAKIGAAAMDMLSIICDERARRRAACIPLYAPAATLQFDGDDLDDDQEIHILARAAKNSSIEFAKRMKGLINEVLWYAAENGWEK